MIHNVYYRGLSGAAAAGAPDRVFWFLFIKLESPARTPNCPRYTDAHIEAVLKEYGGLSLGAGYTFNDLWTSRITGGMVPLEEGVLQARWSSKNRTVLMGDSAAKVRQQSMFAHSTCDYYLANPVRPVFFFFLYIYIFPLPHFADIH